MNKMMINRRSFLVSASAAAGGLVLTVSIPGKAHAGVLAGLPYETENAGPELGAWIAISPDDLVTVRVPTPEIGNGVMTQIPLTVAEELRCDVAKLNPEFASPNRDIKEGGVYGNSAGILGFFSGRSTGEGRTKALLQAGASARERLKMAAANEWGVPATEIVAENSVLTHTPSGRTLRFGEVAEKAAAITLEAEPALKPQSEWTILGKTSHGKFNNPQIVKGALMYGIDVVQPNMLYAALMQSPVQGGKLVSYDFDAIKDMPGVHSVVVVDPDEPRAPVEGGTPPFPTGVALAQAAVAVIADHYWQARKALEALPVQWDISNGEQWSTTQVLKDVSFAALSTQELAPAINTGDLSVLSSPDAKLVEADFWTPYCDQSPLEPLNGTALVTADRVDLWHPSQHPLMATYVAAEEAGVPVNNVYVHQTFVGGGFGRRVFSDDARMVVAVAKKVPGRPVHVIWSREEAMRHGRYRPAVASRFKAALGEDGMPVALSAKAAGGSMFLIGLVDSPYATGLIPNVSVETYNVPINILTGPYRGPGYNTFAFNYEVFIDEMANAAGIDPLEYRLKLFANYQDQGWVKVMKAAAEAAGWGKTLPKGQGMGMAVANWGMSAGASGAEPFFGTTVCTVAQVEVSQDGKLKVNSLDVAFDTGRVMNEEAVTYMMQSGTIFGLNMALNEELNLGDGGIVEGNFDDYPMLRNADIPPVRVHMTGLSGHDRYSEIGEPPVGVVGPAISNAVFAAIGKRMRSMPFRKEDLSWS